MTSYADQSNNNRSADEIRAMQDRLVVQQLAYCHDRSPFYRKAFARHGIDPRDIRGVDDLRKMPILMVKDDERASAEASLRIQGHPFGMHLCAPLEDLALTATTSGTTGTPTFTYTFSADDLDRLSNAIATRFRNIGVKPGERVLFCFALGIYATTISLFGLRKAGALPIDVDARAGTDLMLRMAKLTRPRWISCTPSLAEYLAARAPEVIGMELAELGLRGLILTGESWATVAGVKERIEATYGARAFDVWTPAGHASGHSCDCETYHGLHGIAPELCTSYQDLIDPVSRQPIEPVHGAVGEMVHTSLQRQACPFVKYAYGDIVELLTDECPGCGFSGPRVKLVGRSDDMLIVKGVNVYPAAIRSVIGEFVPAVTGNMRIVLSAPPPMIVPPLKLRVEHGPNTSSEDLDGLGRSIAAELHRRLKINPTIEFVRPGTFEKTTRKTPVFEHEYRQAT